MNKNKSKNNSEFVSRGDRVGHLLKKDEIIAESEFSKLLSLSLLRGGVRAIFVGLWVYVFQLWILNFFLEFVVLTGVEEHKAAFIVHFLKNDGDELVKHFWSLASAVFLEVLLSMVLKKSLGDPESLFEKKSSFTLIVGVFLQHLVVVFLVDESQIVFEKLHELFSLCLRFELFARLWQVFGRVYDSLSDVFVQVSESAIIISLLFAFILFFDGLAFLKDGCLVVFCWRYEQISFHRKLVLIRIKLARVGWVVHGKIWLAHGWRRLRSERQVHGYIVCYRHIVHFFQRSWFESI